jgi:hypothetical protein
MRKLIGIFPISGQGSRFGYKFKPKLEFDNKSFLEHAVSSLTNIKDLEIDLHFICTHEQEKNELVSIWLKSKFKKFKLIIIPQNTDGPLQTLLSAEHVSENYFKNINLPCVICDCDHWLNLQNIPLEKLFYENPSIILPLWNISESEAKSWLIYSNDGGIHHFIEKPSKIDNINFKGVIGCYFFSSSAKLFSEISIGNSISDYIISNIKNYKINTFDVYEAKFFGDPIRLKKEIKKINNKSCL